MCRIKIKIMFFICSFINYLWSKLWSNIYHREVYYMPRRGENIYKRKDGRWEGRYIKSYDLNGKAKYSSVYAKSYTEVKELLKQQNINRETDKKVFCAINMKQLCEEWLESVKITLKPSSYAKYYHTVHRHIINCIGNIKVKFITNEFIEQFIRKKSGDGKLDGSGGLSSKTVHDLLSILLQIIKYAEKKKYIINFNYDVIHPKTYICELPVLNVSEQNNLIDYVLKNLDTCKLGVLIALYTGIRLGELCALTWQDVDFETGTLRINKTLQRIKNTDDFETAKTKVIIDTPKSQKSVRNIPIPSFFIDILKSYSLKYDYDSYILSGTSKYVEPRIYQTKFKKYLKEADISDTNFHALRHTFATRAVEQGFDIKSLSEILGHSSVRFTLERYVHSEYELKKQSMEKLSLFYA